MPNWKKLLVSGSDASLNSLFVSNAVSASIISASSGITGSLFGTASWANNTLTSSYLNPGTYQITASWAQSASQAASASYVNLLAGPNITINYQSNGIAITGSGGSGTPGGPNQSIQFNDSTAFSGSSNFTFDKSTNQVNLSGSLLVSGSSTIISGAFYVVDDSGVIAVSINGANQNGYRLIFDQNGITSINARNRLLTDNNTTQSVSWGSRNLNDQSGLRSVQWGDRHLHDSLDNLKMAWETGSNILYGDNNNSGFDKSIDWNTRILYDGTGGGGTDNINSLNWAARRLFDSVTSMSMNWSTRDLVDQSQNSSMNWDNRSLYDVATNTALVYTDISIPDGVRLYGTASYALVAETLIGSVGSAAQVETIRTGSEAFFYITFVDSNNVSSTPENVYTEGTLTYQPSTNTLKINNLESSNAFSQYITASYISASSGITGSLFGTASLATTASYASSASYINGMILKNNAVAGGTFSGNPKKATVTFTTAFPNTNYSITITGEEARSWTIESKLAGSFIINSNSNTALANSVYWQAISYGEFNS